MKSRTFVLILILALAVLVIVGSCATGKKAHQKHKEPLHGTWINEEYKGGQPPTAIHVYKPDGTFQYFRLEAKFWEQEVERNEEGWIHLYTGPYEVMEKWIDEEGNAWYKIESHYTLNTLSLLK